MSINWAQVFPAHAPSARVNAVIGLDRSTGENILFGGGTSYGGYFDLPCETWSWDSVDWTQVSPATVPAPATGFQFVRGDMGWDGINGKLMMVLESFDNTFPFTDPTLRFFHWDAGDWVEVFFSFVFPGPTGSTNYQPSLSWNPDLGKLLLYASETLGTIYEWDGTDWSATGDFPDITGSIGPPFRTSESMISYDPALHKTVFYGGLDSNVFGNFVYDTALYDGTWTPACYTPPPAQPLARFGPRYMAYLACARSTVIYGNQLYPSFTSPSFSTPILRDLGGGSFDWADIGTADSPTNAVQGTLVETSGGKVMYFGGIDLSGMTPVLYDETWLLSCEEIPSIWCYRWDQDAPSTVPDAKLVGNSGFLTYDTDRGRAILWGSGAGLTPPSPNPQITWEYYSGDWNAVTTANYPTSSPGSVFYKAAYDPASQRVVVLVSVVGFPNTETWTYDGSDWTQESPAAFPVSASVAESGMVFDEFNNRVAWIGRSGAGGSKLDYWWWDGATPTWTQASMTYGSLPAGESNQVAYYPGNNSVIVYGIDPSHTTETWELNLTSFVWSRIVTANNPGISLASELYWEPNLGVLVMERGATPNETWYFDGIDWFQYTLTANMGFVASAGLVYNPDVGKLMLFGGLGLGSPPWLYDTWFFTRYVCRGTQMIRWR